MLYYFDNFCQIADHHIYVLFLRVGLKHSGVSEEGTQVVIGANADQVHSFKQHFLDTFIT